MKFLKKHNSDRKFNSRVTLIIFGRLLLHISFTYIYYADAEQNLYHITVLNELIHYHSVSEYGSETLKCQKAPAHRDMPTMKSLINIYLFVSISVYSAISNYKMIL